MDRRLEVAIDILQEQEAIVFTEFPTRSGVLHGEDAIAADVRIGNRGLSQPGRASSDIAGDGIEGMEAHVAEVDAVVQCPRHTIGQVIVVDVEIIDVNRIMRRDDHVIGIRHVQARNRAEDCKDVERSIRQRRVDTWAVGVVAARLGRIEEQGASGGGVIGDAARVDHLNSIEPNAAQHRRSANREEIQMRDLPLRDDIRLAFLTVVDGCRANTGVGVNCGVIREAGNQVADRARTARCQRRRQSCCFPGCRPARTRSCRCRSRLLGEPR